MKLSRREEIRNELKELVTEARRRWPDQTLTDLDSVEFLCDSEPDLGRLEETLCLYRVLVQGGES